MELKSINLGSHFILLLNNLFSKTEDIIKSTEHYLILMTVKSLMGLMSSDYYCSTNV